MSKRSETVTKSRQKAAAAGRKRLSAMLSEEGSRLYRELAPRFESERDLVESALAALESRGQNDLSREQVIDWINRNTKE